jgi:hypothetical protein
VAEWFKAPDSKSGVVARQPWVRLPPLPPSRFTPSVLRAFQFPKTRYSVHITLVAETLKAPGQPFTFGGVARYASAGIGRVLLTALIFALPGAAVISRVAGHCWWPVITEAVESLPENARIQEGVLHGEEKDARLLAANQFLSLQLTASEKWQESAPVDFAVQLGKYQLMVSSLFGDTALLYPGNALIILNRGTVWPIWGAWKAPLLAGVFIGGLISLIFGWFVLALVYAPVVLFIGGIARRDLSFARAWKVAVAAQWPASLLMTFALALYSTGEIGLLFVLIMLGAHFIPSILNLLIAPFFLPKAAREKGGKEKKNPFATEKGKKTSKRNPFATGDPD